ncbi:uncharacterized protein LOC115925755 [Strongylocentrotus purpuratus]|uniref:Reverse transcriptase domain-containing protein n=1 Tax=Strongylocentrotus purpuratus TaxID=7668 RepID=A0A7M7P3W1_STRPU|nr:uncharacterized protein LOC115925755 [Strongylocentrotus purpuratus]
MDRGMLTGLVLLDLSSAFDTVDHRVLLQRLQEVGIGGSDLSWCQSYLDGRTQAVRIGENDFSDPMKKVIVPHLTVGEARVSPASKVRSLGLTLDSNMSMEPQISSCIRSACYHIRHIRRIRDYLTPHATKQAVHALVTSRLDMYNSTLNGLPDTLIKRLQKVQNSAARLVTRSKLSDHITPVLEDLHWLPVRQRLEYKDGP